jgi:hypothetical protein
VVWARAVLARAFRLSVLAKASVAVSAVLSVMAKSVLALFLGRQLVVLAKLVSVRLLACLRQRQLPASAVSPVSLRLVARLVLGFVSRLGACLSRPEVRLVLLVWLVAHRQDVERSGFAPPHHQASAFRQLQVSG